MDLSKILNIDAKTPNKMFGIGRKEATDEALSIITDFKNDEDLDFFKPNQVITEFYRKINNMNYLSEQEILFLITMFFISYGELLERFKNEKSI